MHGRGALSAHRGSVGRHVVRPTDFSDGWPALPRARRAAPGPGIRAGRAPAQMVEEMVAPETAAEVTSLSWVQMQLLAGKLVAEIPSGDTVNMTALNGADAVVVNSDR